MTLDSDAAASLYPILLPYAERNITFGVPQPVICLGSASLHLALLATVTCRWEVAETHFAAAQLAHDRLRARAFHARADYESARMLIRRGRATDRGQAERLLNRALSTSMAASICSKMPSKAPEAFSRSANSRCLARRSARSALSIVVMVIAVSSQTR